MRRIPQLLVLGVFTALARAQATPAEESTPWTSLRDEGIYSLRELVPGAPPPSSRGARETSTTEVRSNAGWVENAGFARTNNEATTPGTSGPQDGALKGALARPEDPSDWRGRGSYRNYYFEARPVSREASAALAPRAWPVPGTQPANADNDDGDYSSQGSANSEQRLPDAGNRYDYRSSGSASRGYRRPAQGGGLSGIYEDADEDWEPDDGD